MGSLDELLRPDESPELFTRRHAGRVAARFVALVVALGVLATLLESVRGEIAETFARWGSLVVVVVLTTRFLLALLQWRAETILVTNRRILAATGLFRRRVTSIPLRRVEDVSLDRTFGARLAGAGDLLIDLDDRRFRLARVPDPKDFYRLLMALLDEEAVEPSDDEADTGPLPRVPI